jgi:hypothetical protein
VTPLELARAYATLANGGVRSTVRFFEDLGDASGHTLESSKATSEAVLDPGTSYLAVSLLQGVVDRGTAHAVRDAGITGPSRARPVRATSRRTPGSRASRLSWSRSWAGFDQPRGMKLLLRVSPYDLAAFPGSHGRPCRARSKFRLRASHEIDPSSGAVAPRAARREQEYVEGTESRATPRGRLARAW